MSIALPYFCCLRISSWQNQVSKWIKLDAACQTLAPNGMVAPIKLTPMQLAAPTIKSPYDIMYVFDGY